MERRIGYKLFERHGRRVTPTPEAEALYREIEPLYSSFDRIAELNRTSATNAPRLYLFGYPCASGLRYFLQRDAALNTTLRIFLRIVQQSLHEHCPGAA